MFRHDAKSGECYFCRHDDSEVLETHHVVPRRFGGSDDPENLVTVCPNCHQKLEELYGERFYDQLAIYRRRGKTPDGVRIPDNSQHFIVSYDEEGYRQYSCRRCGDQSSNGESTSRNTFQAFFDQQEAVDHLREEHGEDPMEVRMPPKSQRPDGAVQRPRSNYSK